MKDKIIKEAIFNCRLDNNLIMKESSYYRVTLLKLYILEFKENKSKTVKIQLCDIKTIKKLHDLTPKS